MPCSGDGLFFLAKLLFPGILKLLNLPISIVFAYEIAFQVAKKFGSRVCVMRTPSRELSAVACPLAPQPA